MAGKAKPAVDELEALFDSIVAEREETEGATAAPSAAAAPSDESATVGDSDELEALFDRVAAECEAAAPVAAPAKASEPVESSEDLFHRVGQLTRTLHDALRELGYDRKLATAANKLPDARDRLAYIATLTGQAAERVLSSVEKAQSMQEDLDGAGQALAGRWAKLYANELSVDEFRVLAGDTRDFLGGLPARTGATRQELHEIMMAQDFHDLTGQVIKKIVDIAGTLESSLVNLLVEAQQEEHKGDTGWLNGPAIRDNSPDTVKNQEQVDALLESLGF